MQVQFNIESNDLVQAAKDIAELCGSGAKCQVQDASYDGPDGRVQAQVLVVKANLSFVRLHGVAYIMALRHDQDCVAVSITPVPFGPACGVLVGPNTTKWGDFSAEFFRGWKG